MKPKRQLLGRRRILALCIGAFLPITLGYGLAQAAPSTRAQPDRKFARVGTTIAFYGWSENSRWVAYTRTTEYRRRRRSKRRRHATRRLHRKIQGGKHAGFGSHVGGDVQRFARLNGYTVDAWPGRRVSRGVHVFEPLRPMGRDRTSSLTLHIDVDRRVGWALKSGQTVLISRPFDAIYVDVSATLYPSPDGQQALLVMLLDTGWSQDAAVYPVSLVTPTSQISAKTTKNAAPK